ncbi:hypothetical protein [Neobacillus dielmonensis]|uniref:hypothetical protein n=1 Tax=Neobacillus dielmonensis TaxID=1347369 RepID=UPI0005A7F533|nr:hypothetical protein [Neobacillus dielmonensis]
MHPTDYGEQLIHLALNKKYYEYQQNHLSDEPLKTFEVIQLALDVAAQKQDPNAVFSLAEAYKERKQNLLAVSPLDILKSDMANKQLLQNGVIYYRALQYSKLYSGAQKVIWLLVIAYELKSLNYYYEANQVLKEGIKQDLSKVPKTYAVLVIELLDRLHELDQVTLLEMMKQTLDEESLLEIFKRSLNRDDMIAKPLFKLMTNPVVIKEASILYMNALIQQGKEAEVLTDWLPKVIDLLMIEFQYSYINNEFLSFLKCLDQIEYSLQGMKNKELASISFFKVLFERSKLFHKKEDRVECLIEVAKKAGPWKQLFVLEALQLCFQLMNEGGSPFVYLSQLLALYEPQVDQDLTRKVTFEFFNRHNFSADNYFYFAVQFSQNEQLHDLSKIMVTRAIASMEKLSQENLLGAISKGVDRVKDFEHEELIKFTLPLLYKKLSETPSSPQKFELMCELSQCYIVSGIDHETAFKVAQQGISGCESNDKLGDLCSVLLSYSSSFERYLLLFEDIMESLKLERSFWINSFFITIGEHIDNPFLLRKYYHQLSAKISRMDNPTKQAEMYVKLFKYIMPKLRNHKEEKRLRRSMMELLSKPQVGADVSYSIITAIKAVTKVESEVLRLVNLAAELSPKLSDYYYRLQEKVNIAYWYLECGEQKRFLDMIKNVIPSCLKNHTNNFDYHPEHLIKDCFDMSIYMMGEKEGIRFFSQLIGTIDRRIFDFDSLFEMVRLLDQMGEQPLVEPLLEKANQQALLLDDEFKQADNLILLAEYYVNILNNKEKAFSLLQVLADLAVSYTDDFSNYTALERMMGTAVALLGYTTESIELLKKNIPLADEWGFIDWTQEIKLNLIDHFLEREEELSYVRELLDNNLRRTNDGIRMDFYRQDLIQRIYLLNPESGVYLLQENIKDAVKEKNVAMLTKIANFLLEQKIETEMAIEMVMLCFDVAKSEEIADVLITLYDNQLTEMADEYFEKYLNKMECHPGKISKLFTDKKCNGYLKGFFQQSTKQKLVDDIYRQLLTVKDLEERAKLLKNLLESGIISNQAEEILKETLQEGLSIPVGNRTINLLELIHSSACYLDNEELASEIFETAIPIIYEKGKIGSYIAFLNQVDEAEVLRQVPSILHLINGLEDAGQANAFYSTLLNLVKGQELKQELYTIIRPHLRTNVLALEIAVKMKDPTLLFQQIKKIDFIDSMSIHQIYGYMGALFGVDLVKSPYM